MQTRPFICFIGLLIAGLIFNETTYLGAAVIILALAPRDD